MKKFAENFLSQMKKHFDATVAGDGSGKKLAVSEAIALAYELIRKQTDRGGKVILIGNGGSASIASHISVDLWKNGGIKSTAFNDPSLLTCVSNDLGFENVFKAPVEMFAEEGDVLIAISSSGKSKNILNAVSAAKNKMCGIITLSGFGGDNPLRGLGGINFYVPSSEYAFVETIHSAICHALVDCVIKNKSENKQ